MLSLWWDFKGIVYFELLPKNQTINSNVQCHQLMKQDKEIKEKRSELATRKGVIFHQDNARPQTSLDTRKKLLDLGWEVMAHPPYSPIIIYSVPFIPKQIGKFLHGATRENFCFFLSNQISILQNFYLVFHKIAEISVSTFQTVTLQLETNFTKIWQKKNESKSLLFKMR